MFRLAGTREDRLTLEEIEREAKDEGNLLALAALQFSEEMITGEEQEDAVSSAASNAKDEVWEVMTEALEDVRDALVGYLAGDCDDDDLEYLLYRVELAMTNKP